MEEGWPTAFARDVCSGRRLKRLTHQKYEIAISTLKANSATSPKAFMFVVVLRFNTDVNICTIFASPDNK